MRFASSSINNDTYLVPETLNAPTDEPYFPISTFTSIDPRPLNKNYTPSDDLLTLLRGRHLLLDEIPYSIEEVHEHYLHGYLYLESGIQVISGQPTCMRCGHSDAFALFSCARCKSDKCRYCRHCIMMGRVSTCSPLYHSPMMPIVYNPTYLKWEGTLSPGQSEASASVKLAIEENRELLVWAVCGSGKTEVLFKGLEYSIHQNKTVCIATPRTDVVQELLPRLRHVFPHIDISGFYAGSTDPLASIIVSTTHQLIRYKNFFDVMIIDEVDAFPFEYDKSLQYAVQKARKEEGALVYLTATPSKKILYGVGSQSLSHVRIPARFHGHPLPLPQFTWIGNWRKLLSKNRLPHVLVRWIKEQVDQRKPVMLFIPSIKLIEKIHDLFQQMGIECNFVHSEDQDRSEKVARFRKNEIPLLLTSTILERGVTVANVSIGVLGAEAEIFTENALVQIAGRAGRSQTYPDGEVHYFHFGKTEEMKRAFRHIKKMNNEAERKGWLVASACGVEKV